MKRKLIFLLACLCLLSACTPDKDNNIDLPVPTEITTDVPVIDVSGTSIMVTSIAEECVTDEITVTEELILPDV